MLLEHPASCQPQADPRGLGMLSSGAPTGLQAVPLLLARVTITKH